MMAMDEHDQLSEAVRRKAEPQGLPGDLRSQETKLHQANVISGGLEEGDISHPAVKKNTNGVGDDPSVAMTRDIEEELSETDEDEPSDETAVRERCEAEDTEENQNQSETSCEPTSVWSGPTTRSRLREQEERLQEIAKIVGLGSRQRDQDKPGAHGRNRYAAVSMMCRAYHRRVEEEGLLGMELALAAVELMSSGHGRPGPPSLCLETYIYSGGRFPFILRQNKSFSLEAGGRTQTQKKGPRPRGRNPEPGGGNPEAGNSGGYEPRALLKSLELKGEGQRTLQAAGAERRIAQPTRIGESEPPRREPSPQHGQQQKASISGSSPPHADSGNTQLWNGCKSPTYGVRRRRAGAGKDSDLRRGRKRI
ncbi:hypothetical protein F2Q69_00005800 [Brassica cretica]|uniref:Uncharacterized protein n=1 Tax=Brassica cretica TaxID=69181 RepID=A0A8S9PBK8_BRACR|nr:hypothetical protein F2Q69_00005800 [Brassica cretica]